MAAALSLAIAACSYGGYDLEPDQAPRPDPRAKVEAALDGLRVAPGVLEASLDEFGGTADAGYVATATVRVPTWQAPETESVVTSVAAVADDLYELGVDLRTVVATETVFVEVFATSPLLPSDVLSIAVDAETDPGTAVLYTESRPLAPDPEDRDIVVINVSAASGGGAERFRSHWHEVLNAFGTRKVVLEL